MSQADALLNLLSDGKPHSTIEILENVYGGSHLGLARVGARVYELRLKGYEIEGKKDEIIKSIYWYQLKGEKSVSGLRREREAVIDSGESVTPDLYRTQLNLLAG